MTGKEYERYLGHGRMGHWYDFSIDTFPREPIGEIDTYKEQIDFLLFGCESRLDKLAMLHRVKLRLSQMQLTEEVSQEQAYVEELESTLVLMLKAEKGIFDSPPIDKRETQLIPVLSPIDKPKTNPIRWKGKVNELSTVFYNLKKRGYIDTQELPLAKWIVANFVNQNGEPFSESAIHTALRPDRTGSRPKNASHLDADSLLSVDPD
jgi:hypothetical protein